MNFEAYSRYYDLLYGDKDTICEVDYVEALLAQHGCTGRSILELGCGSGRHGEVLKKRGWDWAGIERSPDMAALARLRGLEVVTGSAEGAVMTDRTFDTVTSLFHVVSYLTHNDQLRATFQNVYDHLIPGGLFIFDVWYSPAVYHQRPETRTREVEDDSTKVIRHATPEIDWNRNLVEARYDIEMIDKSTAETTSFNEIHPMRHFSLPELQFISSSCGFDWIFAEEWLTGNKPSDSTWGVCCGVRKV